jgi:hypothetical protein
MSATSELDYCVDGPGIFSAGRKFGFDGTGSSADNPYSADEWPGGVWLDGYRDGELDRLSLAKPLLQFPV